MPLVFIPVLLRPLTNGRSELTVDGATVGEVLNNLDLEFPGIADRLKQPNVAIAIDGEVTPLGVLEPVSPNSEIHFVTAIKGGRN